MVYARDSKSRLARDGSSSLPSGTIAKQLWGREGRSDVEPAGETVSRGRENAQATACALFVTESPLRHQNRVLGRVSPYALTEKLFGATGDKKCSWPSL